VRKRVPELFYKDRTKEIIKANFLPWQLVARDPREGIHRLINRIVSFTDEVDAEAQYIESMFFPDACDLTEPYIAYRIPFGTPESITVSGETLTTFFEEALTIDDFLAGPPDIYASGGVFNAPHHLSLSMSGSSELYLVGESGAIYSYNLISGESGTIRAPSEPSIVEMEVIIDDTHRSFLVQKSGQGLPTDIEVITQSGISLPITVNTDPGAYNPEFDRDNDGIIGEYERSLALRAYGAKQQTSTLAEWNVIGWCDIDDDGYISDRDIAQVMHSVPSFTPEAYASVTVSGAYKGSATLRYRIEQEYSTTVIADVVGSRPLYVVPESLKNFRSLSYDSKTRIYYAVESDGVTLYALKVHPTLGTVVATSIINVPLWGNATIRDIDLCDGMLYVLISDDTETKIAIAYVRDEYTLECSEVARVACTFPNPVTMLGVGSDGAVVVSDGDHLYELIPQRWRYIVINNETYLSQYPGDTVYVGDKPYTVYPYSIFNNFDSFAYSLGLERPYGRDNHWMRNAIFDFFIHRQGNSALGATYGIIRSLGELPVTYRNSSYTFVSPNVFASGEFFINNENAEITATESGSVITTGTCTIVTADWHVFQVLRGNEKITISGKVYDGNGDLVSDSYTIVIPSGEAYETSPVQIYQYDDISFLESRGLITSGQPSHELIKLVTERVLSEPTIWKNAYTGRTPIRMLRLGVKPVLETMMDYSYVVENYCGTDAEEEIIV